MAGLHASLEELGRLKQQWSEAVGGLRIHLPGREASPDATSLQSVPDFGSNPGALEMFVHAPERLADNPALVVALHGCKQTAASFNEGSGWSTLADRHGFVLLLPQQSQANNPQGCLNWYSPADTTRDSGEVLSIRQMIARAMADHGNAPGRVFITGLSAGGAMTAAMLATYPELFVSGAIVAGLPYGAARTVKDALDCMFNDRPRPAREWGDLVRAASGHRGPWPTLSVWHGDADKVVRSHNAVEILKQWTNVHDLPATADLHDNVDGHAREVWRDGSGREVIESWTIPGMGHGTPLSAGAGADQCGTAGAFMLDVGLSSSHHIAKFWGLTTQRVEQPARTVEPEIIPPGHAKAKGNGAGNGHGTSKGNGAADGSAGDDTWWKPGKFTNPDTLATDVMDVIGKALKTAGLTK